MKTTLLAVVGLTISADVIRAQGPIQSMDGRFLFGPARASSRVVPGTSVRVNEATGYANSIGYGYQLARFSSASLWVELTQTYALSGVATAGIPGVVNTDFDTYTLGARIMVPVHPRVYLYGVAGGGGGSFHYPVLNPVFTAAPSVTSYDTWRGVFECGGGTDIRLSRTWSIRAELRDYVTGRGLSGASGRHHVLPLAGVALHFF